MKVKRVIKLINDERINAKAVSNKGCDNSSIDYCYYEDNAHCQVYSTDVCSTKDWAACYVNSVDICAIELDTIACISGHNDYT